jgi:hypothetical protein
MGISLAFDRIAHLHGQDMSYRISMNQSPLSDHIFYIPRVKPSHETRTRTYNRPYDLPLPRGPAASLHRRTAWAPPTACRVPPDKSL